jgi:Zn finger protein HypA/HybF involved in hydrogenase expression
LQKKQKDEEDRLIFCAMHAPQEEEEDDTLYCICQRKYQEGEWMIECEACEGWFHGSCVGVKQEESHLLVDWRCPSCRPHSVPMDVDDGEMQKSKELVVA